jgi:hypothetical protein
MILNGSQSCRVIFGHQLKGWEFDKTNFIHDVSRFSTVDKSEGEMKQR